MALGLAITAIVLSAISLTLNAVNFYNDAKFRNELLGINHDVNSISINIDDINDKIETCPPDVANQRLNTVEAVLRGKGFLGR